MPDSRRARRIGSKIPLYSLHGHTISHISQSEARELHRSRTVRLRVRGHGVNEQILAAALTAPLREEHHSDTAISAREMQGNVMTFEEGDSKGEKFFTNACQSKIAAHPYECDDRAPRAWCGDAGARRVHLD